MNMESMDLDKFTSTCLCFQEYCQLPSALELQPPTASMARDIVNVARDVIAKTKDVGTSTEDLLSSNPEESEVSAGEDNHDSTQRQQQPDKDSSVVSVATSEDSPSVGLGDGPKRMRKRTARKIKRKRRLRRSRRRLKIAAALPKNDDEANTTTEVVSEVGEEEDFSDLYDHCKMCPRQSAVEARRRMLWGSKYPPLPERSTVSFYFEPLGKEVELPRFDIHPLYMHPLDLMVRLF